MQTNSAGAKTFTQKHQAIIKTIYFMLVAIVFGIMFYLTNLESSQHNDQFSVESAVFAYGKLPRACQFVNKKNEKN